MKLLRRFIYFTMMCIILTALVSCPVSEPDDTVKITDLQTAIDKAANNAVLTLSDYPDITKYTATINKPLTIVGSEARTDIGDSTLTITVSGVTVQKVSKTNIIITSDVGNGSCTINDSSIKELTVSGCGISSGNLILNKTEVETAVFDKSVSNNDEYLGLNLQNTSKIKKMTLDTSVALKTDSGDNSRNTVSLDIQPSKNKYACLAVLPIYRNDITEGNSIVSVQFYDPVLEGNEVKARIDMMLRDSDKDSVIMKDFFIQSCKYLLGNAMDQNINSNQFGHKIESDDILEPIENMVDTVKITFHNNLSDSTTDTRIVITDGEYDIPVIGFHHPQEDRYSLYGWAETPNGDKKYSSGQTVSFDQNKNLYAVWKDIFNITYLDRGVSGDVTFDAWTKPDYLKKYVSDEDVTLPGFNDVAKDGYVFQGWYEDKDYTGSSISGWNANTKTGNITLYAKWEYSVSISDIMFCSGDETMTVKWTAPNNANISKVRVSCGGINEDVTVDAGASGSYTFKNLSNSIFYTCVLNAVDNKGNASADQTVNNYCGTYIDTQDYNLVIKGTKHQNTAIVKVIDTTSDVSVDNNEGVFSKGPVTLLPYYIGKYEVTQELYNAVMDTNPSSKIGDMLPVNQITRQQCLKMCCKLNELFGYENVSANDETIDITKEGFRLPTEAEWEFAARGGDPSDTNSWNCLYSGSDTIDSVAWFVKNADKTIHNVGEKVANTLGIYDMSGNVWEWIADKDETGLYMQCGGGYGQTDNLCTVTSRTADFNGKGSASKVCGFRLAINAKVK